MDCREFVLSEDYLDLIAEVLALPERELVMGDEFCYIPIDDAFQIAYLPKQEKVEDYIERFGYRNIPKAYGLMQTPFDPNSLQASGILQTQRAPLSLTGTGVTMVFIDTGIDYTNPVFKDADGNSRILAIWDQTIQSGTPPEGLVFGSEYTRNDINEALRAEDPYTVVPSRDLNGHGSAMAGVAAGSSIDGGRTYLGAAPGVDIVVVKLKECKDFLRQYYLIADGVPAYAENDIMLAVEYASRFAVPFRRPVVICIGLGTNMGDHAGSSALDRYLTMVGSERNIGVVVCGGNEGNTAHHFMGVLQKTNRYSEGNYQNVEIRVGANEPGFYLELWGSVPDLLSIYVRSPGGETIPRTSVRVGESITYSFIYERTKISMYTVLVEESSGEELTIMRFIAPTEGIWTIQVRAEGSIYNGIFHMWLPIRQFLTQPIYFLEPTPYVTLTEPSLAHNIIVASTYNDSNNSFYIESGRGFSRTGAIVPDFAAPGVNISTIYGTRSGSSLSAAITSGAVAQFLQWAVVELNRPYVTTNEIRNYLIRGAERESDFSYPNREWGYGRLNIVGTFNALAGV